MNKKNNQPDMFEENRKSDTPIKQFPVKFKPRVEIDASKVDFSNDKNLDFAAKLFDEMVKI